MPIEDNKALVLKALHYLGNRDLQPLFDLIHEDGSWSVPYDPERFQFGGYRDKPAVMELLKEFLGGFDSFSFTVESIVAEGDRVVVEARSEGQGPGAARYHNNYLMIFFIKDGRLHTVREYFDPFKVLAYVEQIPAPVA